LKLYWESNAKFGSNRSSDLRRIKLKCATFTDDNDGRKMIKIARSTV